MDRTTVRLPGDLLEQAEAHARQTGRTFTQLLEHAVRIELAQHPKSTRVAEHSPIYAAHEGHLPSLEQPMATAAQRERSTNQLLEQVHELQAFPSALPDQDLRSADEIIGYNSSGLPD